MSQRSDESSNKHEVLSEEMIDHALRVTLFRHQCPDTMALGEYQLSQLAESALRDIQTHLMACPHCQTELNRMVDFLDNSTIDELMPITAPAPDLIWYEQTLDQGRGWLEKETHRWRQLWLSLPGLVGPLQNASALSGLMNGTEEPPSSGQGAAQVSPPEAHFELRLTVVPDPTNPAVCRLDVDVTLKNRFGDFSGVQVTLIWGDAAQSQETNVQGELSFTGLLIDQLGSMRLLVTFPA
ncbi:MAG: hypothetical protein KDI79_25080 [Anaerolineae bacterium]|nr:hypothetical protein [Anaerolineae bacterium]